jgi:hypothetical protein
MTSEMGSSAEPSNAPAAPAVLQVAEADYRYGVGVLRLRVEHVDRAHPVELHGERWYRVSGVELAWNGAELGPRDALVRGRCLPRAAGR